MILPIKWNSDKQRWCVYNINGKELWSSLKYVDAATFAEDYQDQQGKASAISEGLE